MTKMISEIKDISYNEERKKWIIWYIDITGEVSSLDFQKKKEIMFFNMGLKWLKDSLDCTEESTRFYETTILTPILIERITSLGRARNIIQANIDISMKKLKERIKLYVKDGFSFDLEIKPIFKLKLD